MAILPIRTFPDPVLRETARDAVPGTEEIRRLARDMAETMYAAPGIGLAAPQVGESVRLIVVDPFGSSGPKEPAVLLNPVITRRSQETIAFEEGCLSCPDLTVSVDRAERITVRFQDLEGTVRTVEADDLLAVVIQHEMDHLEGRLIVDFASPVRRDLYRRKARKARL